jgi:hypothetical protein
MSAAEIEIVPYADAPWAPRLDGAKYAYRVMLPGDAVMTGATRGNRETVTKAAKKLADRLKRDRRGDIGPYRSFRIKAKVAAA